jgi:hypothetical protein
MKSQIPIFTTTRVSGDPARVKKNISEGLFCVEEKIYLHKYQASSMTTSQSLFVKNYI